MIRGRKTRARRFSRANRPSNSQVEGCRSRHDWGSLQIGKANAMNHHDYFGLCRTGSPALVVLSIGLLS